ncbi:MAG: LpqB family beta-propeller domain-containing protein [Actinobacteria bacterium]|nr:LpqB family beta-propeller domain-containing protein [Actinomycetota bacterium]
MKRTWLLVCALAACVSIGSLDAPAAGAGSGRILYVDFSVGGSVFSIRPNGTGLDRLARDAIDSAIWSPNKSHVAFTRSRVDLCEASTCDSVWVMRADGSGKRRLATEAYRPSWSPNGRRLAFVHRVDADNPATNRDELVIARIDGSHERVVALAPDRRLSDPQWSPTGTEIAFVASTPTDDSDPATRDWPNADIYTVALANGEVTRLTYHKKRDSDPRWSPDGTRIAFVTDRHDTLCPPEECPYTTEVYLMRRDGSQETRFSDNERRQDVDPEWSPDGTKLVWQQYVDDDVNASYCCSQRIVIKNVDGSGRRSLTSGYRWRSPRNPDFSPDGRWIVYSATGAWADHSDLFKVRIDGTQRTRLTRTTRRSEQSPDW